VKRTRIKARRTEPRRTRHPFPLPNGEPRVTLAEAEGEAFAFGPQSDLCKVTECAACFAVRHWRAGWPRSRALPWDELQVAAVRVSVPHHEPHRSTTCNSHDRDTYPLCPAHHTDGPGHCVRHRLRVDPIDMPAFYSLLPFDWRAVVAEMRRRVALTKPVVDATASETTP
jgi:hypothetical protein